MSTERASGSDKNGDPPGQRPSGVAVIALAVLLALTLMGFAIAAALLKEATLAMVAGMAAVSLTAAIVHRILPPNQAPPNSDIERPHPR